MFTDVTTYEKKKVQMRKYDFLSKNSSKFAYYATYIGSVFGNFDGGFHHSDYEKLASMKVLQQRTIIYPSEVGIIKPV